MDKFGRYWKKPLLKSAGPEEISGLFADAFDPAVVLIETDSGCSRGPPYYQLDLMFVSWSRCKDLVDIEISFRAQRPF